MKSAVSGAPYTASYDYSTGTYKYLTGITHAGTRYSLEYDQFGNNTASKVGSQTLAANTYGANNGLLQSIA